LEKLCTVFNTTALLTDEATKEIEMFVTRQKQMSPLAQLKGLDFFCRAYLSW